MLCPFVLLNDVVGLNEDEQMAEMCKKSYISNPTSQITERNVKNQIVSYDFDVNLYYFLIFLLLNCIN